MQSAQGLRTPTGSARNAQPGAGTVNAHLPCATVFFPMHPPPGGPIWWDSFWRGGGGGGGGQDCLAGGKNPAVCRHPADSSVCVACLSCASNCTICGSAGVSAAFSVNGGLIRNMPLAGRPGRLRLLAAVRWPDLTVSVACSQLLPALLANVFRRRGSSCASGRPMMGYQNM